MKKVIVIKDNSFDSCCHINILGLPASILEVGSVGKIKVESDEYFKNNKILFSSNNKTVMDVDSLGRITAKGLGLAKITINIQNTDIFREIEFTIKNNLIRTKKISLDRNTKSVLETGDTMNLVVIFDPENTDNKDLNFESSEPTIASIDETGKVIGLRPGLTTITITSKDNNKKIVKKLFVSKNIPYLTKEMLKEKGIDDCNKVMIVAHPDDESLWGGGHLLKDKYFVLCLTNSYNEIRKKEFYQALDYSGNKGIILSYPDLNNKEKSNWEYNKIGVRKDVDLVLGYKEWDEIATHNPIGETGHRQHKFTSQIVTESVQKLNFYEKLMYFGKFYEKGEIPSDLESTLSQDEIYNKTKLLDIYVAEKKSIEAFWHQMIPYENWEKASVWKRNK